MRRSSNSKLSPLSVAAKSLRARIAFADRELAQKLLTPDAATSGEFLVDDLASET
jgi:hypothetical protein